eukprot:scaffold52807_cov15-Tisochrysis_lutea.AAC.2
MQKTASCVGIQNPSAGKGPEKSCSYCVGKCISLLVTKEISCPAKANGGSGHCEQSQCCVLSASSKRHPAGLYSRLVQKIRIIGAFNVSKPEGQMTGTHIFWTNNKLQ